MYNDKAALIKSMNSLLKHITSSRETQQQIFESLEQKDLQKIISNLSDPILQLRLISARLIAQLLFQNQKLQINFCQKMNIYFSIHTEIIVNNNFDKIIQSYPHKANQIFRLLKIHNKISIIYHKNDPLIWFINPRKEMLSVQYLSEQQIKNIIKNCHKNQNPQDILFDPIYCIFGVLLRSKHKLQNSKYKSTQNTEFSQSINITARFYDKNKPLYFQPYTPRTQKNLYSPQFYNSTELTPKRNLQNNQIIWATPISQKYTTYKKQYTIENQQIQNNIRLPTKINLTENRTNSDLQQYSHSKQKTYPAISDNKNNLTDRAFNPNKIKQQLSKSFNLSQIYSPRKYNMNQIYYPKSIKNGDLYQNYQQLNKKQDIKNNKYSLVAPSLKVKTIAMNGRHGWQTTKNTKPQNITNYLNRF